jgi:bacterioferritin-associated ferredoxin
MTSTTAIESPVISLHEAAAALNTTVTRVLMMMKSGALEGECVDGAWEITRDSVRNCPAPQGLPHSKAGCGGCHGCGS